jgi:hypothetical protein
MGRHEKIILEQPPSLRAPAVARRLAIAQRELSDLKLLIGERGLAVAEGKPGAKEAFAALHQKITATAFEIEHFSKARELAARLDDEAIVAWKAAVQMLEPEEIVAGITKDQCCSRCIGGSGCVITGSDRLAGPCAHPLREGLALTRYHENPKIVAVFAAACAKLGVTSRNKP